MDNIESLAVIMPVYNEEEIIQEVLLSWTNVLDELGIDYHIHIYNDGSKDDTKGAIERVAEQNLRVKPHTIR